MNKKKRTKRASAHAVSRTQRCVFSIRLFGIVCLEYIYCVKKNLIYCTIIAFVHISMLLKLKRETESTYRKTTKYNHLQHNIFIFWYLFNCAIYSRIVRCVVLCSVLLSRKQHPNCLDQNEIERE